MSAAEATPVQARLYLPGQAAGMPCRASFLGEQLVIQVQGLRTLNLPAASLTVTTGGFDDDQLELRGSLDGADVSVIVTGAAAQKELAVAAPESIARALRGGHRVTGYHRRKWQVVVATLGVAALTLLLGWWQADAITGWLAGKVPLQREQKLGEIWLRQLQSDGGLRESGPALEAVQQIGARITEGSRYNYRWLVKDDPEINAYAGLGGVVVVHTGLIAQADTAEQLAGVLAHEVQHVEHRHGLQTMIHSAGWAAMLAVALGDVSAITAVLVHQAGNLHHSRKLERVADADGVRALARAGIQPAGMAQMFAKLRAQQQKDGTDALPALLSSHPATAERMAEVERLAQATPCQCRPLALDWAAVQADAAAAVASGGVSVSAQSP